METTSDIVGNRTHSHLGETVAHRAHAGADLAADAADKVSLAAKRAAEQAALAKDKLVHQIEANPLTSVVIAFGLGALVCRLMRR